MKMESGYLVLKVAGKNHRIGLVHGDIRRAISHLSEDDVDTMEVERVFDVDSLAEPVDITGEFATAWGRSLGPRDPVPAFVRQHCPVVRAEFDAPVRSVA